MLKEFRRRFIIQTMILVGVVLLVTFAAIGSIISRNEYVELKNTMAMILRPWKASDGESRSPEPKKGTSSGSSDNKNRLGDKEETEPNEGLLSMEEETSTNADRSSDKETSGAENSRPAADEPPNEDKTPPVPKSDRYRQPSEKSGTNTTHSRVRDDSIATVFYYPAEDKTTVISDNIVLEDIEDMVRAIVAQDEAFGTLSSYGVIYYREKTMDVIKLAITDIWYLRSRMVRTLLVLLLAYVLSMGLLLLISFRLARIAERPLQKAIHMERKFVADISHDLKTPITVIMANNAILRSNPSSRIEDNLPWLDSTDRASEDMMQLVTNMLTLSAVDMPQQKVTLTAVNLTSAAERCLLQLESVAYEKGVLLEEEIAEDLTVLATDEYVKRICSGLLENAVKYEPSGGKIMVKAYSRKRHAYFVVQNQNSRILPEDLPHIFDRFYRGDKSRNQSKGHGLGLPIIKQMATLCGADLQVTSTDKDGTTFTVTFQTRTG